MNSVFGLFLCCVLFARANCELVQLPDGKINGSVANTKNGRSYYQFFAIPYAKPPVNELRFKNPVRAEPWSDVRDATKPPPSCLQSERLFGNVSSIHGQEDCLYLNVFVPNELFEPSRRAPVMVGIHGGGFEIGSGVQYRPDYFMDYDVIFVSVNYRLGALGFLGLNNDEISGNFGMKDQSLALRWVHENIVAFGGDPGDVTLLGQSAGAASIHLHMFSPLSKGLFHKAIVQSGSALAVWAYFDEGVGEDISSALVALSGCHRADPAIVLKCLQRIPAREFIDLEYRFHTSKAVPFLVLRPIIESKVKNQPFLSQEPTQSTYQTLVPWITGITSGDGAIHVLFDSPKKNDKKSILDSLNEFLYTSEPENLDTLVQNISNHYFGPEPEKMDFKDTMLHYVKMFTDSDFLDPFVKTVESSNRQQYVYLYDHRGSFSIQDYYNYTFDLGVCHADELSMLFRDENLEAKWTPEDRKVSETLVKFWTNFAISGDPNGLSGEKIWKPVRTDDIEYLHIKSDFLVMEKKYLKERSDYWRSLPLESKFTKYPEHTSSARINSINALQLALTCIICIFFSR